MTICYLIPPIRKIVEKILLQVENSIYFHFSRIALIKKINKDVTELDPPMLSASHLLIIIFFFCALFVNWP